MNLTAHEYALRDKLIAELNSSLCLPEVLGRARDVMLELIPADYMGLCIVTPGQSVEYEWLVPGQRVALLEQYSELADDDFVRKAVVRQLNTVMRDSEMLPRKELERSLLYQRSRELDLRLEHVMAALLTVSPGVFGGFTLYRDRRRPFTEQSSAMFQGLTRHLVNAVRNCRAMSVASTGDRLLEELHRRHGAAYLVVEPPAIEKLRSPRAAALLEKWFARSDLHISGVPQVLVERLTALTRMDADARLRANTWVHSRGDEYLVVTFVELPETYGPRPWALVLNEFSPSIPLPGEMARQLTARQIEIAKGILRNWSNEQIAEELDLSPATVKTHVRDIFKKLKCDNRADFMYQAARFLKPV
ncbi:LuxR C-terminal-related transcriptional regulator [Myxococcus sp. RHSTA-1-4]|uniref:helix-turn-helix transcriptional regulator n=1 Tax=Myxococcus sp. RHSTA-1-4 TaxID=2874601 RepID=UPI001CBAC542|nr:LuxR C-terminal-related transcriptional regulator [Myxococcus sp. RHSTA-1-4]MBZ4423217.1 LuxR C-terminal-related transcriptional regulator [Myxococcus sp. RHSTA-1-4]